MTFWSLELAPNERVAEPLNLPQPKIELFLIRVDEPPLKTAANSDSPLLRARIPIVLDHAFTNWPLHKTAPPTGDFHVEKHQRTFASHGLQYHCPMGYLIVRAGEENPKRALLTCRNTTSTAKGDINTPINQLTDTPKLHATN